MINFISITYQNQAFNALSFLYREALGISLEGENINALRAKRTERLPVILTQEEVTLLIQKMEGFINSLLITLQCHKKWQFFCSAKKMTLFVVKWMLLLGLIANKCWPSLFRYAQQASAQPTALSFIWQRWWQHVITPILKLNMNVCLSKEKARCRLGGGDG